MSKSNLFEWVLVFIAISLVFASGSIFAYILHPNISEKIYDYQLSNYEKFDDSKIIFSEKQIYKINSDYNPTRKKELGYCGKLDGNKLKDIWVGDIVSSNATHLKVSCPSNSDFSLHFHLKWASPLLSKTDKKSLNSTIIDVLCVYNGGVKPYCYAEDSGKIKMLETIVK